MKSILYLHRKAPHATLATREGVDAALATAAFGVSVALLFLDDGVFQLHKNQQPETARLKRTAPMFEALDMYGVEEVFVCQTSLQTRGLTTEDLVIPVQVLDSQGIQQLFNRFDHLLTF